MNDITKDIKEILGRIGNSKKTYGKLLVGNGRNLEIFKNHISELAAKIQSADENIYNSLIEINKISFNSNDEYSSIYNSQIQRNYYINSCCYNALQAIVKFIDSDSFQSKLKIAKARIFISHSNLDIKYIDAFVEMLEKIGFKPEHLFCSSIQGYNVALNENIISHLSTELNNVDDLYIIMMLSSNYYNSPVCLNEMGVALMKIEYQAILLPKFGFSDIKGAIDPLKASLKLDDSANRISRLNETKDKFVEKFGLQELDNDIWERHRTKFFEAVDKIKRQNNIADKKKLKETKKFEG